MTNFEKYKEEIEKLENKYSFTLDLDGNVVNCNNILCCNCKFKDFATCKNYRINWLFDEYKEPILSDDELDLIKAFNKATGKEWKFIGKNFRDVILFTDEPLIQNSVFSSICEFKKEKGAWLRMNGSRLFSNLTCDVDECILYDVKNKYCHKYK